jgi:hypothetical protein
MRAAMFLVVLAACNPYDSDFGATPFLCGANEPRCPEGYTCLDDNGREVCFEDGSQSGDDNCGDDNGLEPNSTLEEATVTGVDTMPMYMVEGASVCPGVDKDHFALSTAAPNKGIEVVLTVQPADTQLRASILNATGIPITTAMADTPGTFRARIANLPATGYVVQVSGSGASLGTHTYTLTINVTAP